MVKTKLVLALPGNSWDVNFQINLIKLQSYLADKKINYMMSVEGGSNVSFVREKCLGINEEDVCLVKQIKPFRGEVDYEYIMWIDSDIMFEPEWVERLMNYDLDIVSGFYKKAPGYYTATVYKDDPEALYAMTDKDLENKTELIRLKANGMGFLMVKKGVFESIPRPWFLTTLFDYGVGPRQVGEDIYFCLIAGQAGYKIYGDPTMKCGHIKKSILK